MMKKFGSKSIALLMSLIMVFSIFAPVVASAAEWAHDDHEHKKEGPINYVSLGDSMTNGYGLPGYDGDGGVLDYADAAYPNEFAQWLAGTNGKVNNMPSFKKEADGVYDVNHYQLGMSASRIADIHWILNLDYKNQDVINYLNNDSYDAEEWYSYFPNGDHWVVAELLGRRMSNAAHQIAYANGTLDKEIQDCPADGNCKCFGAGEAAAIVAEHYQKAIEKADIISFGFGNGDFGVFMMGRITDALSNPAAVMVYDVDKLLLELTEQEKSAVMDLVNEVKGTLGSMLDNFFGSALGDNAEKKAALENAIIYSTVCFAVNYANVIKDVLAVNKDVEIIQLGLMNTYARDKAVDGDVTIGQILDTIFPPINAYIAALPTYMQSQNDAYKAAKFYYAEEYTVECVLHTFGDDDFYAFEGVARQRFVEWTQSELWQLVYASLNAAQYDSDPNNDGSLYLFTGDVGPSNDIFPFATIDQIKAYEAKSDAEKLAWCMESNDNMIKASKIEVYLAYEKAIATAGLERPVTLGTLMDASAMLAVIMNLLQTSFLTPSVDLSAIDMGIVTPFVAAVVAKSGQVPEPYYTALGLDVYADLPDTIVEAVSPVFKPFLDFKFVGQNVVDADRAYNAVIELASSKALGVKFTAEQIDAVIALATTEEKVNYVFTIIEENVDEAKLVATIDGYDAMGSVDKMLAKIGAMEDLAEAAVAVMTEDNVAKAGQIFSTSENLYNDLMADETVVGVLAVCARHRIGNGLGAHPSVQGHKDVAEEMIIAYSEGHTSADETLVNLKGYANEAYKYAFAKYGADIKDVAAYLLAAKADVEAAKEAVLNYTVNAELDGVKELLAEELGNTADTLEKLAKAFEGLTGENCDEAWAIVLMLKGELDEHLATVKALAEEIEFVVAPYVERAIDALEFYADVVDAIIDEAFARVQEIKDQIVAVNDAYLAFVEYAGAIADKINPEIGKAVREYLVKTPADVFAIIYAYGEEAVLKLITDVANASGKVLDVALGFAALLEEYGEEILYIVTNTDEYGALIAELKNLASEIKDTAADLEKIYADLNNDKLIRDKIEALEAELELIEKEILEHPLSTDYEAKKAALEEKIALLTKELVYDYVDAGKAAAEAAKAELMALYAELDKVYAAIYDLYMATAEDLDPLVASMLKDSIAALLESFGVLENAGADYAAWLLEHFKPMAGEILASILGNTLDLFDVVVPGIKGEIMDFIENIEKEIAEIKAEIEELYEALMELNSELKRLYDKLAELYAKLETAVGDAKEAILAEIEKVKAAIDEIIKAAKQIEAYIKELEEFIAENGGYIDALKAALEEIDSVKNAFVKELLEAIKDSLNVDYDRDEESYYVAIGGNALNTENNYAELLAEKLGVPAAVLGADLRVSDLLAILDAEYVNDAYGTALIDAETRELLAAYYAAEIEAADLITLEFGNADFTTFATTQLLGYLVETNKAELAPFATIMGLDLDVFKAYDLDWTRFEEIDTYVDVDAVLAEVEKALIANGIPAEYVYETTLSDLTGVDWTIIFPDDSLALTIFPADMVMYAVECYLYSAVNYAYNLAAAIEAVHAINPDAEVVVLGTFNALEGLVIDLGDGAVLNVSDFAAKAVAGLNAYTLAAVVAMEKTTYVDIPAVETIIEADGVVTLDEFISIESLGFNADALTPSEAGSAYIAEQIYKALTLTCAHAYDDDCDADCNICGEEREVADHVYDNACDADCNVCGEEREVADHVYDNACDNTCNVCGAERTVPAHAYDNACDNTCNVCGAERTVPAHVYDNACDKTCNVCGAERTVPEHVYANACDADCDVCGATRTPAEHKYANACDADCDVCGATRTPADHKYANDCDADCDVCGATRTPADHKYDNSCDKDCNVCGAERAVDGHLFGEWETVEEATADKEGLKKHTCSECGFEETESIAKLAPQTTEPGTDDNEGMPVAVIVIIVVVGVAAVGTGAFFVLKKFSII